LALTGVTVRRTFLRNQHCGFRFRISVCTSDDPARCTEQHTFNQFRVSYASTYGGEDQISKRWKKNCVHGASHKRYGCGVVHPTGSVLLANNSTKYVGSHGNPKEHRREATETLFKTHTCVLFSIESKTNHAHKDAL